MVAASTSIDRRICNRVYFFVETLFNTMENKRGLPSAAIAIPDSDNTPVRDPVLAKTFPAAHFDGLVVNLLLLAFKVPVRPATGSPD